MSRPTPASSLSAFVLSALALAALAWVVLASGSCSDGEEPTGATGRIPDTTSTPTTTSTAGTPGVTLDDETAGDIDDAPVTVEIETTPGRTVSVTAETADTNAERVRGLQHRESLPPDTGMLFVFPTSREHAFWMKDTLIALDMIFIASDQTVAGVIHGAEPLSTELRRIDRSSRYVLETNAGWAEQHSVDAGDPVRFLPETPVAADSP